TQIRQGRIDEETTVNVGTIEGGKARNIVPELCTLQGEVRSQQHEKAVAEAEKIREIFHSAASGFGAELEFTTSYGCIAYEVPVQHPVIARFEQVCRDLGYPTRLIHTFGGSDNNNFLRNGITGIVLSCGMNKVHSLQEWTHVDELEKCSNIVLKLMTSKE
ncbi:MAG TPA: M20/M25/M40 family metallo-hydrolase, partial [Mobilitalea sp.]|nr:M20/M25/M40 family metallo-hydrolase [Mobilitalea sp.]